LISAGPRPTKATTPPLLVPYKGNISLN
jgi:hypothetical protein